MRARVFLPIENMFLFPCAKMQIMNIHARKRKNKCSTVCVSVLVYLYMYACAQWLNDGIFHME